MSTPGMWEIIFLAVLALLIFGPDKLPGMAKNVGKTVSSFKREAQSTIDELKRAADLQEVRDLRDDLRGTSADIKRAAAIGPIASSASAADVMAERTPDDSTARAQLPAPFDPDAT
jgi:sec-independent protein translocase protein TatB